MITYQTFYHHRLTRHQIALRGLMWAVGVAGVIVVMWISS